jgi:DnaK suppressor protein
MAVAKRGRKSASEELVEGTELSKRDLDKLKKMLLEERGRVLSRLDSHVTQATEDRDNLADEMDMATRHSDQAYLLRLADKEHKLLAEIDHALAKFEGGTFGVCEGTGEPIELRRLEIRPWTRYSLEYKEQLEREKGNRAGR